MIHIGSAPPELQEILAVLDEGDVLTHCFNGKPNGILDKETDQIKDFAKVDMLTKRDNMYLKVFRHTGYESILEGEITETGVGFVIRKKLLRLGDLFKSTKPKAKKQKRDEAGTH